LIEANIGPGAKAWFTTRAFDLAQPGGRSELSERLALPLAFANQVHGDELRWVDRAFAEKADHPACDALATKEHGIGLVIRTADCVPVLLADPDRGLAAAAHVGWRGLLAGVAAVAVGELRAAGAGPLRAAVGPSICGSCYEVGEDLAARARAGGHVTSRDGDGAWRLDLAASVVRQLRGLGVDAIWLSLQCTRESPDLFSWRGDASPGRQGAVIALTPPAQRGR
jgi:YfiH family protein